MKIHQKASLYDELLKDYESLIAEMKQHHQAIENIPNQPEIKNANTSDFGYYPRLVGIYSGSNFGLSMKISKAEGTLNWYKNQK
jgi:hypothetical protein